MNPKLSDKMPAQQDSKLPAQMDASQESEAPRRAGEGGPEQAPQVAISRDSTPRDAEWMNLQERGPDWEAAEKKTGQEWDLTDRKEGANG